jgi:hypothetical protein
VEETTCLKIDDYELELSPETSFELACESVKSKIQSGRVLTEIYIGDKSVGLEDEERIAQIPIGRLEAIQFVSKKIEDLLRESSEMAVQLCEAIKLECSDIREIFGTNDLILAHERIAELSSLVGWLLNVMEGLQSHGEASFFEQPIEGSPAKTAVLGLEQSLGRLHQALEKEDYAEFQAELEAGFLGEIAVWKEIFSRVSTSWSPRTEVHDS